MLFFKDFKFTSKFLLANDKQYKRSTHNMDKDNIQILISGNKDYMIYSIAVEPKHN